jgi:hypothetical protein
MFRFGGLSGQLNGSPRWADLAPTPEVIVFFREQHPHTANTQKKQVISSSNLLKI